MKQKIMWGGSSGDSNQGIVSVTNTAFDWSGAQLATYNWGSQSIGAAPTSGQRRYIVTLTHAQDGAVRTENLPTIDSTDLTNIVSIRVGSSSSLTLRACWIEWPTGTTATFVSSYSGVMNMGAIGIYSVITGTQGMSVVDILQTSTDGGSDSGTFNHATYPNGGCCIAGISCTSGEQMNTISGLQGVTLTEDYDVDIEVDDPMTGAHAASINGSGTQTVELQWDNDSELADPLAGCGIIFGHN